MLQELFRIPGLNLPVYGYGLMLVIGFLAATKLAKFLARRSGLNGEWFVNAALLALLAGVIGARLSHVLENLPVYTRADRSAWENLLDAINIRSGGLTFYGGFLLATPTLIAYALLKKIPLRLGMDIVAPCLMLGLAFGRIGCFLNGCCYGAEATVPWAVRFPYHSNAYLDQYDQGELDPPAALEVRRDERSRLATPDELRRDATLAAAARDERSLPVHPAQLYSAFNAFLLSGLLLAYFTLPHAPGRVFALMLILKGISRFVLEMLRVEPAVLGPLSFSMALSIPIVAVGVVMWIAFGRGRSTADAPGTAPRAVAT